MKTRFVKMAALVAACVMSVCAQAQDVQMATLQHGEQMTAYYGPEAFIQAMAGAQQGDLISLSAGTFYSAKVDKAVTIQGAGYVQDAANGRYRTVIEGDLDVEVPAGQTGFCLEGVYSNNTLRFRDIAQFEVKKLRIRSVDFWDWNNNEQQGTNGLFDQCRIETLQLRNSQNILVQNSLCYVIDSSNQATVSVRNCTVLYATSCSANITNSIIAWPNGGTSFYNNVTCGEINSQVQDGNKRIENWDTYLGIFTNPSRADSFNDDYDYRLTAAAASQYLGNDGTQVGMYGGAKPFTDVPTNPQITQKEVAPQSDANGKLQVKFTIEAQQ